ncbi:MAG: SDR family oxidoreductase [Deltaproteobacteria bacterium]|nr:SDR family oxidoreductase [Deltaproteobacteria bacterium]
MKRFEGKVICVTGGNSGIGRATALAFAREGAQVVIAARRENLGEEVVREIKKEGGEAAFVKTDVTVPLDLENLFQKIKTTYGRFDCAFNNAGVGGPTARLARQTTETWDLVMNTNLKGVWLCMKYEIQQMLEQGGGVIVNTASTAGISGSPGSAIYSASKHGVVGLTRSAAAEYATKNIRINSVCPGPIATPMLENGFALRPEMKEAYLDTIPMGRFGIPEEISGAVLWLCSNEASFITGYLMTIGGGQTITP